MPRQLRLDENVGPSNVTVSTVELNRPQFGSGIQYETLVFGSCPDDFDHPGDSYTTRVGALAGHDRIVDRWERLNR